MSPGVFLLIPFGGFFFVMGAVYARWAIVRRPGQVGLASKPIHG